MIRQDYLLRLIEQVAQVFARLLKLQGEAPRVEFQAAVDRTASEWLGLTREELLSLTEDDLIQRLQLRGSIAEFPLRVGIAIRLLKVEAERSAADGDAPAAEDALVCATCVLLRAHILGVAPELPDFTPVLDELLMFVQQQRMPTRVGVLLMCHYENQGDFAGAEDVLGELRDSLGYSEWLRDLGRAFYDRLFRHPAEDLVEGNLPRQEVEEGIREWNEWAARQRDTQR